MVSPQRERPQLCQVSQTSQIRPREGGVRKPRRTEHFKAGMLKAVNSAETSNKRRIGRFIIFGGTKFIVHLNKDHLISEMEMKDRVEQIQEWQERKGIKIVRQAKLWESVVLQGRRRVGQTLSRASQFGEVVPAMGHLAMSADIFDCHNLGECSHGCSS